MALPTDIIARGIIKLSPVKGQDHYNYAVPAGDLRSIDLLCPYLTKEC